MNKRQLYWTLQFVGWLFFGILQVFLYSSTGQPIDMMLLAGEGLQIVVNIFLTHSLRYLIIRFKWINIKLAVLIPMVVMAVVIMSAIGSLFLIVIWMIQGELPLPDVMAVAIFANLLESGFVFFFWSLGYFVFLYFERYNITLKQEALARETELKNLKSQLNPHFMFNALNSIRALVDENPAKSKQSINKLSNILRSSLNSDRKKMVPFDEELKMVKDYLDLEKIRFEERLNVTWNVCEGSKDFLVPPIMFQTLVENAIKHGVAKKKDGGIVDIMTKVHPNGLKISIRNSGQFQQKKNNQGLGIANTNRRLRLIYGEGFSFKIENAGADQVLTELLLPRY